MFFNAYETFKTYVPALRSETTEGRIQIGGTRILVSIRSLGLPTSGFIITRGISYRGNKINKATNGKGKQEKNSNPTPPSPSEDIQFLLHVKIVRLSKFASITNSHSKTINKNVSFIEHMIGIVDISISYLLWNL